LSRYFWADSSIFSPFIFCFIYCYLWVKTEDSIRLSLLFWSFQLCNQLPQKLLLLCCEVFDKICLEKWFFKKMFSWPFDLWELSRWFEKFGFLLKAPSAAICLWGWICKELLWLYSQPTNFSCSIRNKFSSSWSTNIFCEHFYFWGFSKILWRFEMNSFKPERVSQTSHWNLLWTSKNLYFKRLFEEYRTFNFII